jgi:hypothetical protein
VAFIPYVPEDDIPPDDRVPDDDHIVRIHGVHPAVMRLHYALYEEVMRPARGSPALIGKPGVVPTTYLGPPRCEATARTQRCRAGEPIMVFGRHRALRSC